MREVWDTENMNGEHYFSEAPSGDFRPRQIAVELAGRSVTLTTASGVFSPDHVDTGTEVLFRLVPALPQRGNVLDIGAGWGPIALTMALQSPDCVVWAVDVNERALELVRMNARAIGVTNVRAVTPDQVPDDIEFAAIWSNPPIRIGKQALHDLLLHWLPRLQLGAQAHLVVQKNLGADSLQQWLAVTLGSAAVVERVGLKKGFRVLRVQRA